MALTVQTFCALYTEFALAPVALVQAKLDEATLMCPTRMWGDLTDQGVGLYTAQFLYDSPYSRHMARVDQGGDRETVRSDSSPYYSRLQRLKTQVASGWRVL